MSMCDILLLIREHRGLSDDISRKNTPIVSNEWRANENDIRTKSDKTNAVVCKSYRERYET